MSSLIGDGAIQVRYLLARHQRLLFRWLHWSWWWRVIGLGMPTDSLSSSAILWPSEGSVAILKRWKRFFLYKEIHWVWPSPSFQRIWRVSAVWTNHRSPASISIDYMRWSPVGNHLPQFFCLVVENWDESFRIFGIVATESDSEESVSLCLGSRSILCNSFEIDQDFRGSCGIPADFAHQSFGDSLDISEAPFHFNRYQKNGKRFRDSPRIPWRISGWDWNLKGILITLMVNSYQLPLINLIW